jgi:hypothetical protein
MRTRLLLTAAITLLLAIGLEFVFFKTLAPPRRKRPPVATAATVPSPANAPAPAAAAATPKPPAPPAQPAVADPEPGLERLKLPDHAAIPRLVLGPGDLLPDPPPLKRLPTLAPPQPKEPGTTLPAPKPGTQPAKPHDPPRNRLVTAKTPPVQVEKPRPPEKRAKLAVADHFYQELVIGRLSTYNVLGIDLAQNTQYVLVSRFDIESREADGSLKVKQKVEGVKLSNADETMQAQLNALLRKMQGATFQLTLNARREVTRFEGAKEALQVFTGNNALGGQSFLLWSFLDRDGWKDLAELTFFQPPGSVTKGKKWGRSITHSWGPLGRWTGRITYAAAGKQVGLDRFNYALSLNYVPARGGAAGLPFQIDQAAFRVQQAGGAILYDADRKQVSVAEELFHVRGSLTVSVLGMPGSVAMDEKQVFRVRILDHNPLQQ